MSDVIIEKIKYFESRRGIGFKATTNQGIIWNDGAGGCTYTDSDWKGKDYSESELEHILDEYEGNVLEKNNETI